MRRQTRLAAALLMSLGAAGLAHSQEMTPEKAQARREALEQAAEARATHAAIQADEAAERAAARPGPLPSRFDLEFAGGTVGEYIEAIRAAHPGANLVATPEAILFAMPPVSLKQVDTGAASQIIARDIGDPSVGMSSLRVQEIEVKGSAESVFSVIARAQPPQTARTAVISLAAIIGPSGSGALKIEDVLSAIEAATNMTAPPPKIRFHGETSLLLFHGTAEQVNTLEQTLEALGRTASFAE